MVHRAYLGPHRCGAGPVGVRACPSVRACVPLCAWVRARPHDLLNRLLPPHPTSKPIRGRRPICLHPRRLFLHPGGPQVRENLEEKLAVSRTESRARPSETVDSKTLSHFAPTESAGGKKKLALCLKKNEFQFFSKPNLKIRQVFEIYKNMPYF